MRLAEIIRNREIAYFFRRKPEIAFELALLYFVLAKRKSLKEEICKACFKVIHWLRKAGVMVPNYIEQLKNGSLLLELEKLLVLNKPRVDVCAD
jgi:hypothetical protein